MTEHASLAGISPSLLVRYLRARDWAVRSLPNGLQLLSQDNGEVEVFLNTNIGNEHSSEEMYFALRTLSDYYEKEIEQVVNEISSHLSDRISGRIPDEYVRNDSIEFRLASDYVTGMRNFLASSATTELTASRHFARTVKEALTFTDNCRFGHTFRGSFGFIIESPIEFNSTPTFETVEETLPLGRRVVERITLGLRHIEQASRASDPTFITDEDSGLSANMCEALADLVESTNVSQIKFGIDLSSEWRSSSSGDRIHFEVAHNDVDVIRSAALSLKEVEEPVPVEIIGRIRSLANDGVPSNLQDDKPKREIEVSWISDEDSIIHIRLSVTPEEYLAAVDAHKNGKHLSVRGLLPSSGKTRRFIEHGPITILQN